MISIIIPACNEEEYIARTLNSIKSQNFKDYETIVVCDGCTDKTAEKAKQAADRIIVLDKRYGPAIARNKGAEKANGDLIVFLDADTEITKGLLGDIYNKKDSYIAGTARIKPSNEKLKHRLFMSLKNYLLCPFGITNGIMFCKKETFIQHKGFPEAKKREEGLLLRNLIKNGKFYISKHYVINSTRRFDKKGYLGVMLYWIKETIKPTEEDYE